MLTIFIICFTILIIIICLIDNTNGISCHSFECFYMICLYGWSSLVFFGNNIKELLVINDTVMVGVGSLDHGLDLLSAEVLSNSFTDLVELVDSECLLSVAELSKEFLTGSFTLLFRSKAEHLQEGGEVDGLGLSVLLNNLKHLVCFLLNTWITLILPKATMAFLNSRVVTSPLSSASKISKHSLSLWTVSWEIPFFTYCEKSCWFDCLLPCWTVEVVILVAVTVVFVLDIPKLNIRYVGK